jgi:uncharacterized coiled-coil protein SlyX
MVEHRVTVLETKIEHMEQDLAEIMREVKALNQSLARYKGAWGAVVMVFTALAATGTMLIKYFKT